MAAPIPSSFASFLLQLDFDHIGSLESPAQLLGPALSWLLIDRPQMRHRTALVAVPTRITAR